ncbi:hypothetical protein E4U43_001250 [Claviceps pusilla]|uniref:Integral membrane protein n=1 Tax=Claviceps pusilla TaxID=123648 RepID=A0A9P7NJJ4_9HYPO|nr:hypothetical protein E4U43_001250 [Claviceps pusilla]
MTALVMNVVLLAQLGAAYQDLQMKQGDHGNAMAGGRNESSAGAQEVDLPTYFALLEGRPVLIAHVVMMIVSWVFILPVVVMLSIVRSDLAFTARTMFVVIHALAIVFGSAYNGQTPDLYPNNSHHKLLSVAFLRARQYTVELGWAWNVRPVVYRCQSWRRPSAEFVESGLIFIYGATNIFLEHLGSWGKDWSPQDLEHFSITVLFIGGGLCGIIIESSFVQDFLDTAVRSVYSSAPPDEHASGKCHISEGHRISLNLVPALVILLLGFLMSSHHQSTSTSTMLHRQWGYLLMGASFARGLTYLLIYLRPPLSVLPSRPPTELLVSFGLIAGGLVFMASSSDTIDGMIHHELNPMLLYTVTVGIAELLMAWEMIVLAIKGWALHREMRLRVTDGT